MYCNDIFLVMYSVLFMNKKYFFVHNLASEASQYDWSIPIITTSTYSNSIHYMGSLRSPQPKLHQTMGSLRSPAT
jgi:hypothetical protein